MSLKADLPYPSLEGIQEDCKTLRIVSPAYAGREGELTATLQYVYQSIYLDSCGLHDEAKLLIEIAITEMHHIEILGSLITRLGAPPVFTACPPYPVGFYSASCVNYVKSPVGMVQADIRGEKCAIAEYEQMLRLICSPQVRAVIARIIEDEKVHLAALEALLRQLQAC
jgi:bacterioferritin